MSYLKGETYIWRDDERVHVWVADGADAWPESAWAEGMSVARGAGEPPGPSGVAVPQVAIDSYVVMRFAELVAGGRVRAAIDEALRVGRGNFGSRALETLARTLQECVPVNIPTPESQE
jgi:hypothetical protein